MLRRQIDAVRIVDEGGRERHGISARYAADLILDKPYIGYGKNGVIECLKHLGADRPPPFATRLHGPALRITTAPEYEPGVPGLLFLS